MPTRYSRNPAARTEPVSIASSRLFNNRADGMAADFVYDTPFFPGFEKLISESFKGLDHHREMPSGTGHSLALVLELLVTRRMLDIHCPNAEVPEELSDLIAAFDLPA